MALYVENKVRAAYTLATRPEGTGTGTFKSITTYYIDRKQQLCG